LYILYSEKVLGLELALEPASLLVFRKYWVHTLWEVALAGGGGWMTLLELLC
jgi:hypothetical protein